MKRLFSILLIACCTLPATAQLPENVTDILVYDGKIRLEGTDALGADVFIEYSTDFIKLYQERTIHGVTTYARFHKGRVIEAGTRISPQYEFGGPHVFSSTQRGL